MNYSTVRFDYEGGHIVGEKIHKVFWAFPEPHRLLQQKVIVIMVNWGCPGSGLELQPQT